MVVESLFNEFEICSNEFELFLLMILKCCLMSLKCFFNDLSSSLINFVRSRDPVGEKTTKIGAAASGRRTHKGGSYFGGFLSDRISSSLKINLIAA